MLLEDNDRDQGSLAGLMRRVFRRTHFVKAIELRLSDLVCPWL
jgi:hypothetical protein